MDFDFVAATLDKYGLSDRFDAKKVLLKMSGRRPGKRCKKGWIAAEKQCSDHKTKDGKLTAEGKQSARELAVRVRDRKGMPEKYEVKFARRSLAENLAPVKGTPMEKKLTASITKEHKEERAALNKRRINGGRAAFVDKGQDVETLKKQLVGLDDRIESAQKTGTARKTAATKARNRAITPAQLNSGATKSLESVVSKKVATELQGHPDKAKVKNLAEQIESINSEKAKDSFSDEDAAGFRKRSQARNKQLDGIKGELKKLHKAVQANKPQTLEDRAKGILTDEAKLEKTHKAANSRRQATTREARSGNIARVGDSNKEALARDARELLSQGKSVPSSVLEVLGSRINYNEKGEYKPVGKRTAPSSTPQITPSQLNSGDRKQAVDYNQQGAERAKSEGRSGDASAWEKSAKSARIANVRSSQRQKSTSQGEMFGIEETTDLPLFRKRKDSHRRFDRAIAGGKATPKSTRRKHNCTSKSQQCGTVCISLKKECRDGAVGGAQDRLRKLKKSGADDLQVQRAKQSIKDRTVGKRNEINDKRIGSLRNRVKNATMSGVGKSEGLAELDPNSIEVDPKRFQYKIIGEHTSTGSVGSLSGVRKYDPNLAGILQVWKDPKDGKTYVVNGHNRLDLGKKLGAESVAVRYLKAPDAKTARSIGALTNIAEGRGDALDAAKFFRDTGISKEDLNAKGIPMREKIATEGLALSRLDDSLFRRTIDGDIPMARAAIVGGSGLDAAQQRDLMKLVDKQGKSKNLTDGAIAEMVDIAKSSQTRQESTMSLFGEESVTKSNMIEKAKLQASIKQRLSREKNLFGTVSRGRAASELARGGNTIDRAKSGEISDQANQSLKSFDQMKNLSGPMSDAINRAASRMATGESQKSVEKDLYAEITSIDIFGGTKRRAA